MNDAATIPDLLKQLRDDTTRLVREEVVLAKTEATEKAAVLGRTVAFLSAGALIAYSALMLVLLALAFFLRQQFVDNGMNEGTATMLGLLIIGAIVGIVGAVLISKALKSFKTQSLAPERTIETLREDKQWVQSKISS